jgi:spore coat protein H
MFHAILLFISSIVASAASGDDIFATNAPVLRLKVEISSANMRSLQQQARKPVPAVVREGNTVYSNVLVHVKGAAGSFRDINSNPSLTLSFGKVDEDQRFHGMRKIHVNNSVQDPSQSSYYITSTMFNDAGIPAARVTNARFWLNGRDLGMYVVVEGFTKDFLKTHFKDGKGNLYDGGFLQDINTDLERDSGEGEDNHSDLKALAAAAQFPDRAQRWQQLQKVLDTDRFVDFMVLESFMWDWDGYVANRNNYRVYHDPVTGKMVFIPHGMDQMFSNTQAPIWRPQLGGLVARALMETPEGSKLYRERVRPVFEKAYRIDVITNRLDQLTKRNREAAAEVGRGFKNQWEGSVADIRNRIVARWQNVKEQLDNEPKPLDLTKPAVVKTWRQQAEMGNARLDRPELDGKPTLHIVANGNATASWRSSVSLEPGKYRFQVSARAAKLSATRDQRGEGAGIRISGATQPRRNQLSGDTTWTPLQYDFEVQGGASEVVLVCELRAKSGEVWFDADSLKIEKLK